MKRALADYGMVLVLLAICVLFSLATLKSVVGTGNRAAKKTANSVAVKYSKADTILILGESRKESGKFATKAKEVLESKGYTNAQLVVGKPRDIKLAVDALRDSKADLKAVVVGGSIPIAAKIPTNYPEFANVEMISPAKVLRSKFFAISNVGAIVDRLVPIAIVAIGMTLVILTGGIDLSVGSLIALAGVVSAYIIAKMDGYEATSFTVFGGFVGAVLTCGLVGCVSGWLVAHFKVPPFITTLAFMMMARGVAKTITDGNSIDALPSSMTWLGQGKTLAIPNALIVLLILFAAAQWVMTQTRYGRYIYAVGGNEEAARLSGVPVKSIFIWVYLICGLCAGVSGFIQASQINSGSPIVGVMFELDVIAAVVVGGTSLAGGSGKLLGTMIGALIICVIRNGMIHLGLKDFTQEVVLGAVILAAVLLDTARRSGGVVAFLKGVKS